MTERSLRAAAACLALLGAAACDRIEDKLSCSDNQVELVNSDQSPFPVSILAPGESDGPDKLIVRGASRRITLCFMKGDHQRFRAVQNGVEVATIECVAFQSNYEASLPQTIWTPVGFMCQGW